MSVPTGLWKVEGAGNDFVLGSGKAAGRLFAKPGFIPRLCDRHRGVGADGVLLVERLDRERLALIYHNADGSRARFCGNGTRCAAHAAHHLFDVEARHVVRTDWTDITAEVLSHGVSLLMPGPTEIRQVELECDGQVWSGQQLTLGVEHLLVEVESVSAVDLPAIAPRLRYHPDLGPGGANVSFLATAVHGAREIRTWEMGVERETLCCGSAVAAAGWFTAVSRGADSSTLRARSGDLLSVEPNGDLLKLTGPARLVAEVRLLEV